MTAKQPVNNEMLILAREAEGYTVRELAEALGVNHSTLSRYESGLSPVPEEFIQILAYKLDRPLSYFYRKAKRYGATGNFHRKRSTTPSRFLKTLHARINEVRLQAASLLEWAELETENEFFRLDQREFGGPAGVANELRRLWQIPDGPICNITDCIEGAGGVVFSCDFNTPAIDGVSQWPIDDPSMPPVFFINSEIPGDRSRFTLAHELGHIVMHHLPSPNMESDADQFASEFLMPQDDIIEELQDITIEKAADLKVRWKVSMAAIIRRARDLNVISGARYLNMVKRMSALGYRKCEPIPLPQEEPALFDAIFNVNRIDLGRTDDELVELLSISKETLARQFGLGATGIRLRFA